MLSFSSGRKVKGWPRGEEDENIGSKTRSVPIANALYMDNMEKAILFPMEHTPRKKGKAPAVFFVGSVANLSAAEWEPSSMISALPTRRF